MNDVLFSCQELNIISEMEIFREAGLIVAGTFNGDLYFYNIVLRENDETWEETLFALKRKSVRKLLPAKSTDAPRTRLLRELKLSTKNIEKVVPLERQNFLVYSLGNVYTFLDRRAASLSREPSESRSVTAEEVSFSSLSGTDSESIPQNFRIDHLFALNNKTFSLAGEQSYIVLNPLYSKAVCFSAAQMAKTASEIPHSPDNLPVFFLDRPFFAVLFFVNKSRFVDKKLFLHSLEENKTLWTIALPLENTQEYKNVLGPVVEEEKKTVRKHPPALKTKNLEFWGFKVEKTEDGYELFVLSSDRKFYRATVDPAQPRSRRVFYRSLRVSKDPILSYCLSSAKKFAFFLLKQNKIKVVDLVKFEIVLTLNKIKGTFNKFVGLYFIKTVGTTLYYAADEGVYDLFINVK